MRAEQPEYIQYPRPKGESQNEPCPECLQFGMTQGRSGGSLAGGSLRTRGSFSGIQVIPVENGVEGEEVGSLRLPAPEGSKGKHNDVTLAAGHVDRERAIG